MDLRPCVFFDLDETIFPEIDYKIEGFRAVARRLSAIDRPTGGIPYEKGINLLLATLSRHGPLYRHAIDDLCREFGLNESDRGVLLATFRESQPALRPFADFVPFINAIAARCRIGLITDGPPTVQRRKFAALGIMEHFDPKLVIFSQELDSAFDKNTVEVFLEAVRRSDCIHKHCAYIGDNPTKDFHQPHQLGWLTVRLRRGALAEIASAADVDLEASGLDQISASWIIERLEDQGRSHVVCRTRLAS